MAESDDVQALEKISTEVDESKYNIILSSQCIKAQGYLVKKLWKQSEQQKQVCNFITSGNLKLEAEIKISEKEIKSLNIALDTIKVANVELKKEMLIAKESKVAVIERVNNGIKKYEELWISSKKRYESIPFIYNYLQIQNKTKTLQENISNLRNETQKLNNAIDIRKIELIRLDRHYIIEFAKFMVKERPQLLKCIQEKGENVAELLKDIKHITKDYDVTTIVTPERISVITKQDTKKEFMNEFVEDSWSNLTTNIHNAMMLPKLKLCNIDLDILSVRLDQIKKVDSEYGSKITVSEQSSELEKTPTTKSDDTNKQVFVSSYFQSPKETISNMEITEWRTKNYSEKKLIHILKDIKLTSSETYNIVSSIKPNSLQNVDVVKAQNYPNETQKTPTPNKINETENDEIEEINLINNQSANILIPPTPFLDITQNYQEKRCTFDSKVHNVESVIDLEKNDEIEIITSDNKTSHLNMSTANEDSYVKIKEIVFKKHNLDLSPQFIYSKNSTISMRPESTIVASNFFLDKTTDNILDSKNKVQVMEIEDSPDRAGIKLLHEQHLEDDAKNYEYKDTVKKQNNNEKSHIDIPVTGFLFTHGPQGIPDSLNMSTCSTGCDEGEGDYPSCIDSSLFLSPKADAQLPESNNNSQILSQEVPNFLSGIRKTGFSFFEKPSENKIDPAEQSQSNNFSFSFGNNEKKNRGGFFSMFH